MRTAKANFVRVLFSFLFAVCSGTMTAVDVKATAEVIPLEKALSMYKWIKETRMFHLTLGDVQSWKAGDKKEVLMLDRNFEEYGDIWDSVPTDTAMPPGRFFEHNKALLTYKGNLVWDITFDFGETIEHPVHICTEGVATNWRWCALETDGSFDIKNEMRDDRVSFPAHKKAMHFSIKQFHPATRVGWRGPMIEWQYISQLPPVFWHDKLARARNKTTST